MGLGPTRASLVVAALLLAGSAPVDAQIVNTLRRWSTAEPGWSGRVEASFALAEGNTEYLELSAGASAQFVGGDHRVRGLLNESFRRANGEKVAEAFLAHLRHNYRLTELVSTLVFVQHQSDPFRRLQRRTLLGAGTRLDVVRADDWEGSIGLSYMVESERLTDDPGGEAETEGRGSFFLSAIGDVTDNLRIDLSTFYQPLFSDFSDARAYTAASVRVDVVGELDLVVRFDLTHESRPPEGVEETDLRFSTGLLLDF
jgi:putative salt-induced outer membrane protein YdiY